MVIPRKIGCIVAIPRRYTLSTCCRRQRWQCSDGGGSSDSARVAHVGAILRKGVFPLVQKRRRETRVGAARRVWEKSDRAIAARGARRGRRKRLGEGRRVGGVGRERNGNCTCACVRHRPDVQATPGSAPRAMLGWHQRHPAQAARAIHAPSIEYPTGLPSSPSLPLLLAVGVSRLLTHANGGETRQTSFDLPEFCARCTRRRCPAPRRGNSFFGVGRAAGISILELTRVGPSLRKRFERRRGVAEVRGRGTPVCRVILILHASRNAIPPNASKADYGTEKFFTSQKVSSLRAPYATVTCTINWLHDKCNVEFCTKEIRTGVDSGGGKVVQAREQGVNEMRNATRSYFLEDKNTAPAVFIHHDPSSFPVVPSVEISFSASPLLDATLSTQLNTRESRYLNSIKRIGNFSHE